MKISIIIPAYNEELYLEKCLSSIEKHRTADVGEVFVVDNGSTDKTSQIAGKFPFVKVISEPRKGTNNARQKGFEMAQGDILAFIDADTIITKQWFDKIGDFFQKNPKAISLSGPCKYYDGSRWMNSIMNMLWWISAPIMYRVLGYLILSGNFVVRREALKTIDGFNVAITFYGDDAALAKKLKNLGPIVFDMSFFLYTSSRRFMREGIIKTNVLYVLNFLWPLLFDHPFTKDHEDIRTSLKKNSSPSWLKAWAAVIFLFIVLVLSGIFSSVSKISLPLIIFFLVLLFNTFFSIELFAYLTPPEDNVQNIVDIVLFIMYVTLIYLMPRPLPFMFLVLFLFIIATMKYTLLQGIIDHPKLLKQKVLVDTLGIFAAALTVWGIIFWNPLYSIWIFAIGFTVTNIILFTIWPLYRADHTEI